MKILFCNRRFLEVYNNIHQAVKKMESSWIRYIYIYIYNIYLFIIIDTYIYIYIYI